MQTTTTTNKPPAPPPGLPSVSQRISAIQMAARSHSGDSSESNNNHNKKPPPMGGQAMILPQQPQSSKKKNNSKVAPAAVPLVIYVDDERDHGDRIIKESKRSRFMRWKNSGKYPTKEADI